MWEGLLLLFCVCVGFCFPQIKVNIYSAPTDGHCRKTSLSSLMPAPLSIHVISEIYDGPSTHFPPLILELILLTFKHLCQSLC